MRTAILICYAVVMRFALVLVLVGGSGCSGCDEPPAEQPPDAAIDASPDAACSRIDDLGVERVVRSTERAGADETIVLQGDGVGHRPWTISTVAANGCLTPVAGVTTVIDDDHVVALTLPPGMPRVLLYASSPDTRGQVINRPRIVQLAETRVRTGGTFAIYGRNLDAVTTGELVETGGGASVPLTLVATPDGLSAIATAGAGVIPGASYGIVLGGATIGTTLIGRADPDPLALGVGWSADFDYTANVIDATLPPYGVTAGPVDQTLAINQAIAAAHTSGGVVLLPPGDLIVGTTNVQLVLSGRVILRGRTDGQGKPATRILRRPTPTGATRYALWVEAGASVLGVEHVAFVMQGPAGDGYGNSFAVGAGVQRLFLRNVELDLGGEDLAFIGGITDLLIANSYLHNRDNSRGRGPASLSQGQRIRLFDNRIELACGELSLHETDDVILRGNSIQFDGAARGPLPCQTPTDNADIPHLVAVSFASHLVMDGNQLGTVGPSITTRDAGESLVSEGGGAKRQGAWFAAVTSTTSSSTTLATPPPAYYFTKFVAGTSRDFAIAIVSGRGAGQWRPIEAIDLATGTITHARWTIPPAVGDRVATVRWSGQAWTIRNNAFDDAPRGIVIYEGAFQDLALTGNTFTDATGIYLRPGQHVGETFDGVARNELNLLWDTTVTGNVATNPRAIQYLPPEQGSGEVYHRAAAIGVLGVQVSGCAVVGQLVLGFVARDNRVEAHGGTGANANPPPDDPNEGMYVMSRFEGHGAWASQQCTMFDPAGEPFVLGALLEGNTTVNARIAYRTSRTTSLSVIRRSTDTDVTLCHAPYRYPPQGNPAPIGLFTDRSYTVLSDDRCRR